jgi:hypothetical protein
MSNFLDKKMSQQKRMTDDMKNTLDKFAATVRINSPAILKEADSNRDNEPVDIDLESLGSKSTDE